MGGFSFPLLWLQPAATKRHTVMSTKESRVEALSMIASYCMCTLLRASQFENGYFRWSTETDRHKDGSDASIDVELAARFLEPSLERRT